MKSVFILLLLVLQIQISGLSQTNSDQMIRSIPLSKHFDSDDYAGGFQNWKLDQDKDGILYAANNAGLLEFDGNTWTLYEVPNCTKVRALLVDEKDRIFIGGQGQIGYFSKTKYGLVFTSLLDKLPPEYKDIAETWKILELDGEIYFNTESQLIVLQGENLRVLDLPGYIHRAFVVNGKIMAQLNNVLFEITSGEFDPIEGTDHILGIISILPKPGGLFYFTDNGLIYENKGGEIIRQDIPVDLGTTNVAIRLHSGEYCVGTQYNGLYIFNQDLSIKQHFTKNEGVLNRTILSLHEDQFNNLWIATNNGIDYLEMSLPFSMINEDVGLEGTGYASILFDNQIFLGTNNGLFVQKIDQNTFGHQRFELFPGSYGQVYNLSQIEQELILGHHRGAFQIKGTKLLQFHDMGSWKFIPTRVPGLILGGDYQGIMYFHKKGDLYTKTVRIGELNESSRVLEFENDSVLWMTHGSKGAFRLNFDDSMHVKGEINQYGIKNGFPSNDISVYSLNNQLVFTAEDGIYNFDVESRTFNPNQFFNKWLGTKQVVSIVSNGKDAIYYIQDNHMGRLVQESFGTYRVETELFKHINKFMNDDLPNISIIDEHNILIGAKEGFIKYDPEKEFSSNHDFHVLLRSIEVQPFQDSSTLFDPSFLENFQLEKNQSVKFHFAAPYFDGFEDIRYGFRLLPVEEKWSKWTPEGEREYSFLSPGKYIFEIKALNVYGDESLVTSFSFEVLKLWYATNPAIFAYFVIGMMLILLVLLVQQRRHHAEKSIINQDKEKALQQKDEEIDQISQKSKEEINSLMNEKLRTEIDMKNDQLTTFTMHFMNSNEFIQDSLKKIESNLDQGGSVDELREIIRTIDRNLSNNDSWEQFAYHFDQVHGDYLKKLSENNITLSPREIKLAAFLRMNLSSKEISTMLNITERGVELARYRLRKKLKLERDQNLVEYLIELDNK